jgi:predicted dehydrogenase
MKKIGLMGCGVVADYGHLPAIKEVAELELFALFDPLEERLRRTGEKFGAAHIFQDEKSFFDSGIEVVTITSPAPCHLANVLGAAEHGLPVLCEKPMAVNRHDAQTMIAKMAGAGLPLYVAFCYRFSPSALRIRELVAAGMIGSVRTMRLIYNWGLHGKYQDGPDGGRVLNARREGRMQEGGPMLDCGTHQIDLAAFWLQSPVVRVIGHGSWTDEYTVPDHIWAHLDHANGAHTVVEISYSYTHTSKNQNREFIYELIGTEGVIRYDAVAETFSLENGQGRTLLPYHHEKSFTGMYHELARALETGESNLLATAQEGMAVVAIAQQATEQAMEGRIKR